MNLNGIRSASKKGFFEWAAKEQADFICLQEVRAKKEHLDDPILSIDGYHKYFFPAQKSGYSGVAIYSKHIPDEIIYGQDNWAIINDEGRYIQTNFGNLNIASIYLPSGTSGSDRQDIKYDFLEQYSKILKTQKNDIVPYIICGDINIAHKPIDLTNWRANQKSSGFLPKERAWLDVVFDEIGFVDAYRFKNPDKIEYTWWSNFANAWANNVGWRIDYQIISPALKDKIIRTEIYREEKFSDHAPVIIEYDLNI